MSFEAINSLDQFWVAVKITLKNIFEAATRSFIFLRILIF